MLNEQKKKKEHFSEQILKKNITKSNAIKNTGCILRITTHPLRIKPRYYKKRNFINKKKTHRRKFYKSKILNINCGYLSHTSEEKATIGK